MTVLELIELVKAFVPLLTLLVTTLLVPWLLHLWSAQPRARQQALAEAARRAVEAAEQLYRAGALVDRKAYAYRAIEDELAGHGLTVTDAELDSAIEAAVLQLKSWVGVLPDAPRHTTSAPPAPPAVPWSGVKG